MDTSAAGGYRMGLVTGFRNDVFISYAHGDNRSENAAEHGWVNRFHELLDIRLMELLGTKAEIWRDLRLSGTDIFNGEISDQLADSAVLITIISPLWSKSKACRKELRRFQEVARTKKWKNPAAQLRILQVVKTPLPEDSHRGILPSALCREFYVRESQSKLIREYEFESPEFREQFQRVAQNIADLLQRMQADGRPTDRIVVFVAQVTSDLREDRQRLCNELEAREFRVLPEGPLPEDGASATAEVTSDLAEAVLAVHLIGPTRAVAPENEERSLCALQYDIARDHGTAQVVWIKQGTPTQPRQQEFLDVIRGQAGGRVELLDGKGMEYLKEVVLGKLAGAHAESGPKPPSDDLTRIYLVCDRDDHPIALPEGSRSQQVRKYLHEQGFEVKVPLIDVAPSEARADNRRKLELCDAVLLFWGEASNAWLDERLWELVKARGWRRARDFSAKAIYITTPPSEWKRQYTTHEARVIVQFDSFSPEALGSFLRPLRVKGATT